MDKKRLGPRAAVLLILSGLFFFPALNRLMELTADGTVRRVDVALVLAGAFAAGNLFALAIASLRARRENSSG